MLGMWVKIVRLISSSQHSHVLVYFFVASLFLSYVDRLRLSWNFSAIVSTVFRFGALSLVVSLFLEDQNSSNETLVLMLTPLRVFSQVPVLVWALYNLTRYIRKKSWHGRD